MLNCLFPLRGFSGMKANQCFPRQGPIKVTAEPWALLYPSGSHSLMFITSHSFPTGKMFVTQTTSWSWDYHSITWEGRLGPTVVLLTVWTLADHTTLVTQFLPEELGALGSCLQPLSQGSCEDGVCKMFCFALGPSATQPGPSVFLQRLQWECPTVVRQWVWQNYLRFLSSLGF